MKNIVAVIAVAVLVACASAAQTRFKDKIVLVTGGSSGIGYQTALQFAQEGAKVVITARDSKPKVHTGAEAAKKIKEDETVTKNGGDCRFIKADLTNADDVAKLFKDILSTEKTIDFAVNAAGISGPMGRIGDTKKFIDKDAKVDPIMNNVYCLLRAITEEEYIFVDQNKSGVIVNVVGVQGITPTPDLPLLGASKYASIGLSKSVAMVHIAADNPPYIRVNSVAPGPIGTPLLYNQAKFYALGQQPFEGDEIDENSPIWKQSVGNFTGNVPMQRVGKPNEVANTILWLCTDEAEHISADTVIVDGGYWSV